MDHKTAECISLQYADTDANLIGACRQLVSRNSHITRDVSVASGISLNVDQQEIPREYLCNRKEISKRCTCRVLQVLLCQHPLYPWHKYCISIYIILVDFQSHLDKRTDANAVLVNRRGEEALVWV